MSSICSEAVKGNVDKKIYTELWKMMTKQGPGQKSFQLNYIYHMSAVLDNTEHERKDWKHIDM